MCDLTEGCGGRRPEHGEGHRRDIEQYRQRTHHRGYGCVVRFFSRKEPYSVNRTIRFPVRTVLTVNNTANAVLLGKPQRKFRPLRPSPSSCKWSSELLFLVFTTPKKVIFLRGPAFTPLLVVGLLVEELFLRLALLIKKDFWIGLDIGQLSAGV